LSCHFRVYRLGMRKLIPLLFILTIGLSSVALGAASRKTSGVAYVSPTHAVGQDSYVSGDIKDKILGDGAIVYRVKVTPGTEEGTFRIKARKVTIYTAKGSLSGTGEATQTIAGETVTVSAGSFTLTKGTGDLKGHRLTGEFAGDQKDGVYKFAYTGTYR